MAKIDVYRDWLKIEATNRPLTYYQLLRLKTFEDDVAVIRKHYRDLNAYIRKFATGDYIDESQSLLNELAKAMLCLTDSERKEDYDFSLGRKSEQKQEGRRTLEDILIQNKVLSREQVKKAKYFAEAIGVDLEMAILQQKLAAPEAVMLAYAESIGLPFVNLDDIPVDEYYASQINPVTARQHSFVPVMADMGKLILASPVPVSLDVEEELRILFEMPVRSAICTPNQVNAAIAKYYPRDAVQMVVSKNSDQSSNASVLQPNVKAKKLKQKTPLSKEAKAKRLKISVISFNFAFMTGAFGAFLLKNNATTLEMILPGIVAGLIALTIAWFALSKNSED
ncbi:MAG: hypothetical protein Q4C95_05085 [Planctomycetia bacterium]|nr:hypothetical protein [Planctomycetia bacterium]